MLHPFHHPVIWCSNLELWLHFVVLDARGGAGMPPCADSGGTGNCRRAVIQCVCHMLSVGLEKGATCVELIPLLVKMIVRDFNKIDR